MGGGRKKGETRAHALCGCMGGRGQSWAESQPSRVARVGPSFLCQCQDTGLGRLGLFPARPLASSLITFSEIAKATAPAHHTPRPPSSSSSSPHLAHTHQRPRAHMRVSNDENAAEPHRRSPPLLLRPHHTLDSVLAHRGNRPLPMGSHPRNKDRDTQPNHPEPPSLVP